MLAHAILAALIVSIVWIVLQNLLMHCRPTENRFRAMALGYLLSLPFVFVVFWLLPPFSRGIAVTMRHESFLMGLLHAYLVHLLGFFFYGECFYYVERSVTLRLLVELLRHGGQGASLQVVQQQYSVGEMIYQRLNVLRDRGFIEQRDGRWYLRTKGIWLVRLQLTAAWLFQFKPQHERV